MGVFRISFYTIIKVIRRYSRYTRKEFKKPRQENQPVFLSELIKTDCLESALVIAQSLGDAHNWILNEVEEVLI